MEENKALIFMTRYNPNNIYVYNTPINPELIVFYIKTQPPEVAQITVPDMLHR